MSEIKVEKVVRPGSLKAIPYPFTELKVEDEDSFAVPVKEGKTVSSVRSHISSSLMKAKESGVVSPDFSIRTLVETTEGKPLVRVWKSVSKNKVTNK